MMYYGNSGTGWVWMIFWMLLVTVLGVGVIWAILRSTAQTGSHDRRTTPGGDNALGALQHRYAAGEIDEEEYERRRQVLLRSRSSGNT